MSNNLAYQSPKQAEVEQGRQAVQVLQSILIFFYLVFKYKIV